MMASAFPLSFDISPQNDLYAYVYNEVNELNLIEKWQKNVDKSFLSKNQLTKDVLN
jgi:hypothetical protein